MLGQRSVAHGKTATMDSCVEIKILLIKNEGKKGRKDKPERNRERELIAIRQKLKSEREPRNKKEKILKYFVH